MNTNSKTLRDIVMANPTIRRTFEQPRVDCCGGGPVGFFGPGEDDLTIDHEYTEQEFVEKLEVGELIDYIVERHHGFTRREIGRLRLLMERVCHKHVQQYPELYDLKLLFNALCDDITTHMRREEFHLFPYIKNVQRAHETNAYLPFPKFGTVSTPVRIMMADHDTVADFMDEMRGITDNFSPPRGACLNLMTLYAGFTALEKDLYKHVHLENNILFPAAILLEQDCFMTA